MTTFSDWSTLPVNVKASLDALEQFVGDVDGKEIDDGTVDADDAVRAVNALAAEIARLRARPTEEEVAREVFDQSNVTWAAAFIIARAVIAKFPEVML
jgi:hypothetical protein